MTQNSSFVGVNKYSERHNINYQREKDQGNIKNFKETKSGQNLNNNFATTKTKIAQTQRSSRVSSGMHDVSSAMSTNQPVITAPDDKRLETQTLQVHEQPSLFDKAIDSENKKEDVIMKTTSNCITAPTTNDLFKKGQSSNKVLDVLKKDEPLAPTPFQIESDGKADEKMPSDDEEVPADEQPQSVSDQMEARKKDWVAKYKRKLDLNDVLEIRNP